MATFGEAPAGDAARGAKVRVAPWWGEEAPLRVRLRL